MIRPGTRSRSAGNTTQRTLRPGPSPLACGRRIGRWPAIPPLRLGCMVGCSMPYRQQKKNDCSQCKESSGDRGICSPPKRLPVCHAAQRPVGWKAGSANIGAACPGARLVVLTRCYRLHRRRRPSDNQPDMILWRQIMRSIRPYAAGTRRASGGCEDSFSFASGLGDVERPVGGLLDRFAVRRRACGDDLDSAGNPHDNGRAQHDVRHAN